MAFVGEVDLIAARWRNTDVSIFPMHRVSVERDLHREPIPADPVRTVAVADEGNLTFTTDAVEADLVTGVEADDNALRFTAVDAGADGNDITIAFVDPAANSQSIAVDVTGTDIEVSLATDGSGDITSTAADIVTAIEGDVGADALVAVVDEGASDGTGVVEPVAATNLTHGGAALAPGSYAAVAAVNGLYDSYVGFKVAAA